MTVPEPAPVSERSVAERERRYWIVMLVRAIATFACGMIITFTAAHSPLVGLTVFGLYGLLEGLTIAVGSFVVFERAGIRWPLVAQGLVGVVVGIIALVLDHGGLSLLLHLCGAWALVSGGLEFSTGLRMRGTSESARTWITIGSFTLILGVLYLVVLSDSLNTVGIFGAYAAIVGVYLGIEAFTLKWGIAPGMRRESRQVPHES